MRTVFTMYNPNSTLYFSVQEEAMRHFTVRQDAIEGGIRGKTGGVGPEVYDGEPQPSTSQSGPNSDPSVDDDDKIDEREFVSQYCVHTRFAFKKKKVIFPALG